jgi:hypothetical protein
MILRGAEFHRNGHGRCGLLPNRISSSDKAELPSSRVLPHAGIILVASYGHLKSEAAELVRLSGQETVPCDTSEMAGRAYATPDCPMSKGGRYVVSLQHR